MRRDVTRLVSEIRAEHTERRPWYEPMIEGKFLTLVTHLIRSRSPSEHPEPERVEARRTWSRTPHLLRLAPEGWKRDHPPQPGLRIGLPDVFSPPLILPPVASGIPRAYTAGTDAIMDFRMRLLLTLRVVEPVLREPGVMIAGSEVPNLLEPDARSTLIVSKDLDVAVPVERHAAVKARLREVRGLKRSEEEPSVWLPLRADLLEVNFIGMDTSGERAGETYVLEDDELPLLVFAHLSLLRPGKPLNIEGLMVPVPRPAGLLLEKLLTDRSGEKGDRDLLVALAVLLVSGPSDLEELEMLYRGLSAELRYAARSGLSALSLLEPRGQMPDPIPHRALLAGLMERFERMERDR